MTLVLVVDDDETIRSALRRSLLGAGYEVECAHGGYEAMRMLDECRYDAVVTDIQMADGDGLELLIHARKVHPRLAVITMSGSGDGPLLESALGLGARAVLAKPFTIENLVETIESAIGGSAGRGAVPG